MKKTDKELMVSSCLLPHCCPWCRPLCSELQLDKPEDLEGEQAGKGILGSREGCLEALPEAQLQELGCGRLCLNQLFPNLWASDPSCATWG